MFAVSGSNPCRTGLSHQQGLAQPYSLGSAGRGRDYCFSLNHVGIYESCGLRLSQPFFFSKGWGRMVGPGAWIKRFDNLSHSP